MADPWDKDIKIIKTLRQSVEDGDLDAIKRAISNRVSVDYTERGTTLLLQAVISRKWDIADYLLGLNADVQRKDEHGRTALDYALQHLQLSDQESFDIVQKLVKHGADVNAQTVSGWTPMHIAAMRGHLDALALFLFYGANVNAMSARNETILSTAVVYCAKPEEVLRHLILCGADTSIKDDDGFDLMGLLRRRGEERRLLPCVERALWDRKQPLADALIIKSVMIDPAKRNKQRKFKPNGR